MAEEKKKELAPKTNVPGEVKEKKEKVLIVGITRGRMPIAVVAMVRFGDQKNEETKALATMFGTTVGKITDIKKRSTFAYLPENFRPNQAQKDEGIAWLKRHVDYAKGAVDGLINELEKTPVATEAEAAAYEAIRAANKGQRATTKKGDVANAGGGNRQKTVTTAAPKVPPASASDLLK
jgi:hypothetical protein